MKSQSNTRQFDSRAIPDGAYKEAYTPVANIRIKSPALNKFLKRAKFQLSQAATVTYRTIGGTLVIAEAITSLEIQPYVVSEIHSVSVGTCFIIHDGEIDLGVDQP